MTKNKGFSPAIIVVVVAVVLLGASAAAYYMMKGNTNPYESMALPTMPPSSVTPTPVSSNDDTSVIEAELNSTTEGSVEGDLNQLDTDASSL